jgi:hypothetical protein
MSDTVYMGNNEHLAFRRRRNPHQASDCLSVDHNY